MSSAKIKNGNLSWFGESGNEYVLKTMFEQDGDKLFAVGEIHTVPEGVAHLRAIVLPVIGPIDEDGKELIGSLIIALVATCVDGRLQR